MDNTFYYGFVFIDLSNHIKTKAIKMLSCKNFAILPDPPLLFYYVVKHGGASSVVGNLIGVDKQFWFFRPRFGLS